MKNHPITLRYFKYVYFYCEGAQYFILVESSFWSCFQVSTVQIILAVCYPFSELNSQVSSMAAVITE